MMLVDKPHFELSCWGMLIDTPPPVPEESEQAEGPAQAEEPAQASVG